MTEILWSGTRILPWEGQAEGAVPGSNAGEFFLGAGHETAVEIEEEAMEAYLEGEMPENDKLRSLAEVPILAARLTEA